VATAACKRLSESLRTIEEYSKIDSAELTTKIERMRYNAYTLEQRLMNRLLVRDRFREVRLYVLISSRMCRGVRETARAAIAGGADALQLREKDLPDAHLLALAAELRELTDETGRLLIINDRPDIAAIIGADGVHLGQGDLPIAEVRRLLRPGAIVGRSTHSMDQVRSAVNEGADYVSAGPMFPTATKDAGPILGPAYYRQVASEVSLPVVAIGGINPENLAQVTAAGARCVAVSSAICGAENPQAVAEAMKQQLQQVAT
jgi:thiamine-phosphate pyrophosphorylase